MIVNDEWKRIKKKTVVGYSKALFQYLLGGAEEKSRESFVKIYKCPGEVRTLDHPKHDTAIESGRRRGIRKRALEIYNPRTAGLLGAARE
jgi:hypothetical protein